MKNSTSQIIFPLKWPWLNFYGWTFLKKRIDEIPAITSEVIIEIKKFFFTASWYEVYNFIETIPKKYVQQPHFRDQTNTKFIEYTNVILKRELSAYRFINGLLTPIASNEEIKTIENVLNDGSISDPIRTHLYSALKLVSDKVEPDYRNSIKESISAVEAYCKQIANSNKATLGEALKIINENNTIHPALLKAFSALYGYTSNAHGIRHSLLEADKLDQEDALFMLISCSAFINLIKIKQDKVL